MIEGHMDSTRRGGRPTAEPIKKWLMFVSMGSPTILYFWELFNQAYSEAEEVHQEQHSSYEGLQQRHHAGR